MLPRREGSGASRGSMPQPEAGVAALLPVVYDELRRMARGRLRLERGDLTLSTTELVHEAWLRLGDNEDVAARGRNYFFAAASQAMRRIVVDHARRRRRLKRGGGRVAVTLDETVAAPAGGEVDLLELEDALQELARVAARPAQVVECRFFGGLSADETAQALGITPRTVHRDWAFARAWLYDHLTRNSGPGPDR